MTDEAASNQIPVTRWEHFEHGADIGVRGFGPTLEAAFAQAAVALTAVVAVPAMVRAHECIEVECEAPDLEMLLMTWLNAVVSQMGIRHMLFGRYRVTIQSRAHQPYHLRGEMWGEAVDVERHQPSVEVKGATATELHVVCHPHAGWVAQCIVDV